MCGSASVCNESEIHVMIEYVYITCGMVELITCVSAVVMVTEGSVDSYVVVVSTAANSALYPLRR